MSTTRTLIAGSALALASLVTVSCASKQKVDPTDARAAVYGTDYNRFFQEVALAVKKEYPNLAAQPQERVVKTAWHPLPFSEIVEGKEDPQHNFGSGPSGVNQRQGGANDKFDERRAFRRDATTQETKNYVRFDVAIEPVGAPGDNQWKVVVTGQASTHDGSGIPVELKGAERPYWLDGRIAALEVAIYNRVKKMSVATR